MTKNTCRIIKSAPKMVHNAPPMESNAPHMVQNCSPDGQQYTPMVRTHWKATCKLKNSENTHKKTERDKQTHKRQKNMARSHTSKNHRNVVFAIAVQDHRDHQITVLLSVLSCLGF